MKRSIPPAIKYELKCDPTAVAETIRIFERNLMRQGRETSLSARQLAEQFVFISIFAELWLIRRGRERQFTLFEEPASSIETRIKRNLREFRCIDNGSKKLQCLAEVVFTRKQISLINTILIPSTAVCGLAVILDSIDQTASRNADGYTVAASLGILYEQTLAYLPDLSGQQNGKAIKSKRSATAAFYTPLDVAQYMISNASGLLIDDSQTATFLDPACGSGIFLQMAIKYILDRNQKLDGASLNKIVTKRVFGADINPTALMITRLNIWLTMMDYTDVIPSLFSNFVVGNALNKNTIRSLRAKTDRGFDLIIGNPPYIRHESLDSDAKTELQNTFRCFHPKADLFTYFFEMAISVLSDRGVVSLITSRKWIKADYGQNIRNLLLAKGIHSVIDFGNVDVFGKVAAYPAITTICASSKTQPLKFHLLQSRHELASTGPQFNSMHEIKKEDLARGGWDLSVSKNSSIDHKVLAKGATLGSALSKSVYYGVKTGYNEAFVITKLMRDIFVSDNPRNAEVIFPYARGKDVTRYELSKIDNYIIILPSDAKQQTYPELFNHLRKYRKQLEPKPRDATGAWTGRAPGSYKWFQLQSAPNIPRMRAPKLVYQVFQVKPAFAFDTSGLVTNNSLWNIETDDSFLLGYLNSKVAWHFISKHCTEIRGGYQLIYKYLEKIPVPQSEKCNKIQVAEIRNLVGRRLRSKSASEKLSIDLSIDIAFINLFQFTLIEANIINPGFNIIQSEQLAG